MAEHAGKGLWPGKEKASRLGQDELALLPRVLSGQDEAPHFLAFFRFSLVAEEGIYCALLFIAGRNIGHGKVLI